MAALPRRTPWWQRINLRIVVFILAVVTPIGYLVWPAVELAVTGGIRNRGDYFEVDLKKISLFEMDQVNATDASIPAEFRALDGKRVLLVGEMYDPMSIGGDATRITEFDLVYSIAKCCVTSSPKIQHFVKSKVRPGMRVSYYPGRLVKVMGTFHVGIEKGTERIASVYRLDVESVEPVK